MNYEATIGLEIHLQLATKSKMFCACPNASRANDKRITTNKERIFDKNSLSFVKHSGANTAICPICLGHPGALPTINEKVIEMALLLGSALNGEIRKKSYFERKKYFYPDLPKGYQISQKAAPLVKNAYLEINSRKIRIHEIHLEEDTAKLYHLPDKSLIDFNRAGVPLLELVTEPDIKTAKEAKEFCQELQLIVKYLGISEANMEKGEMRCEVNISLREIAEQRGKSQRKSASSQRQSASLGTKVEIKNLNSFRSVERAIEYEIKRQTKILEKGGKISQETRGWDESQQKTVKQRLKEESQDYRYFPEPDLPPLEISEQEIRKLKAHLLELPLAKRRRFIDEYEIGPSEAKILTQDKDLAAYLEKVIMELQGWLMGREEEGTEEEIWQRNKKRVVKKATDWMVNQLLNLMNNYNVKAKDLKISPENFAEFITLILDNRISAQIGQMVLERMFQTGRAADTIISEEELKEETDENILEEAIIKVVNENQKAVEDYKKGKETAIKFLIGKAMLATHGKANVELVKKILEKRLK